VSAGAAAGVVAMSGGPARPVAPFVPGPGAVLRVVPMPGGRYRVEGFLDGRNVDRVDVSGENVVYAVSRTARTLALELAALASSKLSESIEAEARPIVEGLASLSGLIKRL